MFRTHLTGETKMKLKSLEEGIPSNEGYVGKMSFCEKIREYFKEYSNKTSIHGFRYFGEKRSACEKIWWSVSISISLYFCVILILDTYQKWERSPVIVTFATTEKPIWQISFPAVTICPEIKTDPTIFNYTAVLHKKLDNMTLTPEEETYFGYMSLVCTYRSHINYNSIYTGNINGDDIQDFFHNVTYLMQDQFDDVKYMGNDEPFKDLFTPILTGDGVCYTFNILDRQEIFSDSVQHYRDYHKVKHKMTGWNMESEYSDEADRDAYPMRALFAGAQSSLELKLQAYNNHTDYTCRDGLQGYKVEVHHPAGIPGTRQQYFRIPLDQSVIASIEPKMIITSDKVKSYNPRKRECYFPTERHLKYFKFYTQYNCQLECKTNYTLEVCGCVNFYMPRDNMTSLCGASSIGCMMYAEDEMLSRFISSKLNVYRNKHVSNNYKKLKVTTDCDCLPSCNLIDYSVELSQTDWDWEKQAKAERRDKYGFNKSKYRLSSLRLFFKTSQFIPLQRNELYGPTDFLANFGGLLGLFTGFSMLSFVEIIYFLTLRVLCNIRLYGGRFWTGYN